MTDGRPRIIIETDLFSDVDDAGALALANILMRREECELLGVCVNTASRWGPYAAGVINRFYGNDVAVGACLPADDSVSDPDYAKRMVEVHDPDRGRGEARSALAMHRELLTAAADQSITLVSIGFYVNLVELLRSNLELMRAKVARTVVMGGRYPSGREFNFGHNPTQTAEFLAGWPTPVTFVGAEVGAGVITGRCLDMCESTHPIRLAYELHSGAGIGRSSWDLIAVYIAVFGEEALFRLSEPGTVFVDETGANTWWPGWDGQHQYVVPVASNETIARTIDTYLCSGKLLPLPSLVDTRIAPASPSQEAVP